MPVPWLKRSASAVPPAGAASRSALQAVLEPATVKVDFLTVLSSFTLLVGGLVTSFIMELLVYASIYEFWKWNFEMKRGTVDVRELPIPELRGH